MFKNRTSLNIRRRNCRLYNARNSSVAELGGSFIERGTNVGANLVVTMKEYLIKFPAEVGCLPSTVISMCIPLK